MIRAQSRGCVVLGLIWAIRVKLTSELALKIWWISLLNTKSDVSLQSSIWDPYKWDISGDALSVQWPSYLKPSQAKTFVEKLLNIFLIIYLFLSISIFNWSYIRDGVIIIPPWDSRKCIKVTDFVPGPMWNHQAFLWTLSFLGVKSIIILN